MQKNPFLITAAVASLIVVAALATLGVLSAFAGEKSGLEQAGRHGCSAQVTEYMRCSR
jgi:hypothetical protein